MNNRMHIYLVYLLLVSFFLTGISLSRYSKFIPAVQEARVAQAVFEYVPVGAALNGVPVASVTDGINVSGALPGDVLVFDFNIVNFNGAKINQVLLKYNIAVVFSPEPATLPLTYEIVPAGSYPSAGGNWTYLGFGEEKTHSYSLKVMWAENDNAPAYIGQQQTIQIKIDAEQADSIDE